MATAPAGEETLVDLGRRLADDAVRLVQQEVALARVQLVETARRLALAVALVAGGALSLLIGSIYALAALPQHFGGDVHDEWVGWAGFGGLWLLLAAALLGVGAWRLRRALREAKHTLATMKEDVEWAKRLAKRDAGWS